MSQRNMVPSARGRALSAWSFLPIGRKQLHSLPTRHVPGERPERELQSVPTRILLSISRAILAASLRRWDGLLSLWAELSRFFLSIWPLLPSRSFDFEPNILFQHDGPTGMPRKHLVPSRGGLQRVHTWKLLHPAAMCCGIRVLQGV